MKRLTARQAVGELRDVIAARDTRIAQLVAENEKLAHANQMLEDGWRLDSDLLSRLHKRLSKRADGARIIWHLAKASLAGIGSEKHHAYSLSQTILRVAEEMGEAAGWKVPLEEPPKKTE